MTDRPTSNDYPELTERDAELLSAYIDDMLTDAERATLEARLANEPFLARELVAMRQTVAWVNALPTLRAPRDFTLTVAQAEAIRPRVQDKVEQHASGDTQESQSRVIRFPVSAGWLVASAAAMLVLVFGAVFLLNDNTVPQADMAVFSGESALDDAAEVAVLPTQTALPTTTVFPTALPPPQSGGAGVGGASVESVVVTIDQTKEPMIITESADAQAPIAEANTASTTNQVEAATLQYSATNNSVALSMTATPITDGVSDTADVAQASAEEDGVEEIEADTESEITTARSADDDDDVVIDEADVEEDTMDDMADSDFGADESASTDTTTEAIVPSPLQRAFALISAFIETLTGIINR